MAKGKRTPSDLKVLQGTDQKCRTNFKEPKLPKGLGAAPINLNDRVQAAYDLMRDEIDRMNVAQSSDKMAAHILAEEYAAFIACGTYLWHVDPDGNYSYDCFYESETQNTKDGVVEYRLKTHPATIVRDRHMKNVVKLLGEFGMTPASRQKVVSYADPSKNENKLAQLLKKKNQKSG